jgi:hypothetical protein
MRAQLLLRERKELEQGGYRFTTVDALLDDFMRDVREIGRVR